ncbi:MAG: type II/IV secretion system ATPase subunit [Thermoplasmata archaeon]|nr:type II/IV secretion system ATPase subunit [Thermoplasmata archaeon]
MAMKAEGTPKAGEAPQAPAAEVKDTATEKVVKKFIEEEKIKTKLAPPVPDLSLPMYEVLESYTIHEGLVYVKIVFNRENHLRYHYVIEPPLTSDEEHAVNLIEEVLVRTFDVRLEDLDEDPIAYLREVADKIIRSYGIFKNLKGNERDESLNKVFYYVRRDLLGYGRIDPLMADPNIEDVSCDGPEIPVFIYHRRHESLESNIMWPDEFELESYIIRLAQRCGKHISVAEPLLDATLMDGSRVVMTLGKDISTRGSTYTIRKFREEPFTPTDLIKFKTFSPLLMAYTWMAVQYGMSILFVGGTASGKTTSLNATSLFIPHQVKIVSIEETREVNLPHPNWVPGCTRVGFGGEASASGKVTGEINMYDLLKAALRQRPEYIIVGEIRGAEAYVLFQAMATGHTTYSTVHADSVPSLIHRLENKPIDIPRVMLPSLDACSIQIQTRIKGKRVRRCKQMVEIIGLDPHTGELLTNEAFRWNPAEDEYEFFGKSYVLENIMVLANLDKEQLTVELKTRQRILEWLVERDINDYREVSGIINEYYVNPDEVLRRLGIERPTTRKKEEIAGAPEAETLGEGFEEPIASLPAGVKEEVQWG